MGWIIAGNEFAFIYALSNATKIYVIKMYSDSKMTCQVEKDWTYFDSEVKASGPVNYTNLKVWCVLYLQHEQ